MTPAPEYSSKTVLITGASSGIGRELAWLFAADGYSLVLIARDEEKLGRAARELQKAHSVSVTILANDLSRRDSADEIFAVLQQKQIEVCCLVNNAGFGDYGLFHQCDWQKQEQMISVNVVALTRLTRLLLPAMISCKDGKILNVASTASFFPGPLMSVYYATKAYVLSFSHALANETIDSGVTVSCFCPGLTKTDFQNRASMGNSRLMQGAMMDAKKVAQIGYDGFMKGHMLIVPGRWDRWLLHSTRFLPERLKAQIIRRAQDKI